jgi:N-acetylglucosaminyl-diphospho-decaprenol L-rhamnosyltransferase
MPDLSIIIVSHNTRALLQHCLDDLLAAGAAAPLDLQTVVVDNASTDGSRELLAARYPAVEVIASATNQGFAAANNLGLAAARAPVALLLNSDAFVTAPVLRRACDLLRDTPLVGLVGVRLVNEDGSLQATWETFPTLATDIGVSLGFDRLLARRPAEPQRTGPADWVQGACIFVRMTAFASVGGFDETFFMYSEEVDWCRRFWARDWQVWYLGEVAVVHLGGASSRNSNLRRRRNLYRSRLGLRRRFSGPAASGLLWGCMLAGLTLRATGRAALRLLARRHVGRHAASDDWALACAVARMDPLARWATL